MKMINKNNKKPQNNKNFDGVSTRPSEKTLKLFKKAMRKNIGPALKQLSRE